MFILGMLIGAILGMFCVVICVAAKEGDADDR